MENSDEAMKVTIICYVKNKIEIDVIRRLIIQFQSFSDDWPTSVDKKVKSTGYKNNFTLLFQLLTKQIRLASRK